MKINREYIWDYPLSELNVESEDFKKPKDFVDVYFIDKELMRIEEVTPLAKQKHIGLDEYWLARAMFQVKNITFLPRMIKRLNIDDLKDFFLRKAESLIQK